MADTGKARGFLERVLGAVSARLPARARPYAQLATLAETFGGAEATGDALCLGDSVLERVSHHDADRRTLGQMIAESARDRHRVLPLSDSGYTVDVYHALLEALAAMTRRPELVIVTLNVRCFSPQWDLNPAYAFREEIQAARRFARAPTAPVPRIRRSSPSRAALRVWFETPVQYPASRLRTVGEFQALIAQAGNTSPERLREIFVYHYMHPLSRAHRKLAAWVAMLDLVEDLGMRGLAYVTPVNLEGGTELVGPELAATVRSNVATISDVLNARTRRGVQLLDLSELLGAEDFFRRHEATEHINAVGRRKLSERLLAAAG